MVAITVNITGVDELGNSLLKMRETIVSNILQAIQNNILIVSQVSQDNVNGPAIAHSSQLAIDTGRLYESLGDNITTVQDDDTITGETGTDAVSDSGFPYPKYWENMDGLFQGAHSPFPRPFLVPALESVRDQFLKDIKDAIEVSV